MSFSLEILIGLFRGVCGCVVFLPFSGSLHVGVYPVGLPREGEPVARIYAKTSEMRFLEVLL